MPTLRSIDKLLVLGIQSECRKTLAEAKPENTRNPKAKREQTKTRGLVEQKLN